MATLQMSVDEQVTPSGSVSLTELLANPHLPTPPAVALQLIQMASQPNCDLKQLVALLSTDPGLCGKVLQTVNSTLFSPPRPITSLERAVVTLGIRPLRSLVLGLSLPALQTRSADPEIWRYWQQSVVGAVIVRDLAMLLRHPQPDDSLVAALLRDLGILVLRQTFARRYESIRPSDAGDWFVVQCERERSAFGLDHAEVGAALLQSWKLPAEIVLPVRYHHDPAPLAQANASPVIRQRGQLLCFGSRLALLDRYTPSAIEGLVSLAQNWFGLDRARLVCFLSSIMPRIQEFAAVLQVDIGQCPNYAAIVSAGSDELVRLSVQMTRPGPRDDERLAPELLATPTVDRTELWSKTNGRRPVPTASPTASTTTSKKKRGQQTMAEFDLNCLDGLPPGTVQLNGFEIKDIIGRGAMGVIFKAYDPLLDRYAAIKMLTSERLASAEARERFMREARAAAAIQHPNVITIYAVGDLDGIYYLVMEYFPGGTLQEQVDRQGALPISTIIRCGRQLAAGLQAAHQKRVVHRDIKPANVLVEPTTGLLKITDFGLARNCNEGRMSGDGCLAGTPLYMAPEQFATSDVDHRADLFSFGSLLYTLCSGRTPFKGDTVPIVMRQICEGTPIPLESLRREVPAWLCALIRQLMKKNPSERLSSAGEALTVFERHGAS